MTALQAILVVGVAVAAMSIAIFMVEDLFAELDRRRRENEIVVAARRQLRQRQS